MYPPRHKTRFGDLYSHSGGTGINTGWLIPILMFIVLPFCVVMAVISMITGS